MKRRAVAGALGALVLAAAKAAAGQGRTVVSGCWAERNLTDTSTLRRLDLVSALRAAEPGAGVRVPAGRWCVVLR